MLRSAFYLLTVIAVVWSLRTIEIIPEFLYDAPQQTVDLFARMWPIDWSWYPKVVHAALMETLHTATLGTILAVVMASLVALLVARNITRSIVLNTIGRFILVATRSVHAMVWALFFVAVFGPGALAGTLAIAVHSIGFTGKFLAEAIEEAKPGPIEALTAAGASPLAILLKGYWPQVKPAFLAIAMFRWDINVRESAVLGLVGGGGLGMALERRAQQSLLGPGRAGAAGDLCGRDRHRDRDRVDPEPDHLSGSASPTSLQLIGDLGDAGARAGFLLGLAAGRAAQADAADGLLADHDRHAAAERNDIGQHPLALIGGLGPLRPGRGRAPERARGIGLAAGELEIVRRAAVALHAGP